MKIVDYQINNNNLIIECIDNRKIINNFTDDDLIFVLLKILKVAKELNDTTKEKNV